MDITAVVDRIENGNAILLSNEVGLEISIPVGLIKGSFNKGQTISLIIDSHGKVICEDQGV